MQCPKVRQIYNILIKIKIIFQNLILVYYLKNVEPAKIIVMATTTFNISLTNQQVIDMVKEVSFSEPEKIEILKLLVGGRNYLDKKTLAAEVTELIYSSI